MNKFVGVCRVVKGMKNARLGAVGARPGAFNTVRYSEKLMTVDRFAEAASGEVRVELPRQKYLAVRIENNK